MLHFNKGYFLLTVILFLTEVLIAIFLNDSIIRPFGGDFLVVMLMYCFVKTFMDVPVMITACAVLAFSYLIEFAQYFQLGRLLGWDQYKLARIVLGTSFSVIDLLAYTLGIILVIIIEKTRSRHERTTGR